MKAGNKDLLLTTLFGASRRFGKKDELRQNEVANSKIRQYLIKRRCYVIDIKVYNYLLWDAKISSTHY